MVTSELPGRPATPVHTLISLPTLVSTLYCIIEKHEKNTIDAFTPVDSCISSQHKGNERTLDYVVLCTYRCLGGSAPVLHQGQAVLADSFLAFCHCCVEVL